MNYTKLTTEDRRQIVELASGNRTITQIARTLKFSTYAVSKVLRTRQAMLDGAAEGKVIPAPVNNVTPKEVVIKNIQKVREAKSEEPKTMSDVIAKVSNQTEAVKNIITIDYNGIKLHMDTSKVTEVFFLEDCLSVKSK